MSSRLTTGLCAGLLVLAGCSNNGGLWGSGSDDAAGAANGAAGGIGAIEESSIEFFNTSVGDRILFLVDQSTLTTEAIAVLDAQAAWLTNNPGYSADIEGHADEQGTREYNLALSAKRASAAQNYLISRGVAPGRLSITPYGKERPLAICSDESCWAQNRRAVTVVVGGFSS